MDPQPTNPPDEATARMRQAELGFWASRFAILRAFQQMGGIASRIRREPTSPPQNMQELSDVLAGVNNDRSGEALDRLSKGPS